MKLRHALPTIVLAVLLPVCAPSPSGTSRAALESLVQAEMSFARTSVAKGIREAFLTYLADSCIVFRPHPVNGPSVYRARPEAPFTLDWRPIYADVSSAGDFGYTTGPWQITDNSPQKRPPGHGNYFSVWQKQADGNWKVIIDLGISNPEPKDLPPTWQAPALNPSFASRAHTPAEIEQEKSTLLQRDLSFSAAVPASGLVAAYQSHLASEARLLRMGEFPLTASEAIRTKLSERQGASSWRPLRAEMAQSLDLAYTMGAYEFKPARQGAPLEKGYYVRVWKKQGEGAWKVVLEVENPLPPEMNEAGN